MSGTNIYLIALCCSVNSLFLISGLTDYQGEGPNVLAYVQILKSGVGTFLS